MNVSRSDAIPLNNADGSEGLPICRAQREWLTTHYQLEPLIALKFFSGILPVIENEPAAANAAIEHVRKCPKCREWFHSVIPADVLHRQSRLSRYCCPGMFVAVEESGARNKNKITFELYRGEDPCWMIGGVRSFISFCPWCGKKLPDKPFIPES